VGLCVDDHNAATDGVLTRDSASPSREIGHDVSKVFFFDVDGEVHDWLEQNGGRLPHGLAERTTGSQFKRPFLKNRLDAPCHL